MGKKHIGHFIFGFIFTLLCLFLIFLFAPTVSHQKGVQYVLKPGTSRSTFVKELDQHGIIRFPVILSLYIQLQSHHKQLKAGEYFFPEGASSFAIWRQVTQGIGVVYHAFTIVPGWTFSRLKAELQQIPTLKNRTQGLDDKKIMALIGQPDRLPEGMFLPETYYYTRGVADLVILKQAAQLMQKKLAIAWQSRTRDLPYQSDYEALIAASLIEKEAYRQEELPLIAGVLVNRLRKNMLLQFDPTVIYGLGADYKGKIYKTDLLADTTYNTYRRKGLPPTPIAMPSLAAIQAALHPAQNDYLYFVAKGDGSHQFSRNLIEHNRAVKEMIKQQQVFFNNGMVRKYLIPLLAKGFSPDEQQRVLVL
jgi:UPF0755 protein